MRIFLSVPMKNKKPEDIEKEYSDMKECINKFLDHDDIEYVTNYYTDEEIEVIQEDNPDTNIIAWCLGQAALKIADCDSVAFHPEFAHSEGCCIELDIAKRSGTSVITMNPGFTSVFIKETK